MYYNARWYDPYLNHFTQPDTIVPDPYNSQDYDRYAYARNNPVRYTDPTGHDVCDEWGNCFKNRHRYKINGQTPRYTIIMCGRDGKNDCETGSDSDLKGYNHNIKFDDDNCGRSKAVCSDNVFNYVSTHFDDPYTEFRIIGHSAGADAAILAVDKLLKSGYKENIKGLVILDPTLTSGSNEELGYSDYSNDDKIYGTGDDLGPLLAGVVSQGVSVFVGLGIDSLGDMKTYLNPLTTNQVEFTEKNNYDYHGDYSINHAGMATSEEVKNDVLRFLK